MLFCGEATPRGCRVLEHSSPIFVYLSGSKSDLEVVREITLSSVLGTRAFEILEFEVSESCGGGEDVPRSSLAKVCAAHHVDCSP